MATERQNPATKSSASAPVAATAEQVAAALATPAVDTAAATPPAVDPEPVSPVAETNDATAEQVAAEVTPETIEATAEFVAEAGFGLELIPEPEPAPSAHEPGFGPEPDASEVAPTDPEPTFIGDLDIAYTCEGGGSMGGYENDADGNVIAPASQAPQLATHGFFPVSAKEKSA